MKITTLFENSTENPKLYFGHGLSLYIEHQHKKILFDLGCNRQFWKNAKKLGIDLKEVDCLILSHGHYDHGTALRFFMRKNKKAKVYVSENIFDKHLVKWKSIKKDIGIKEVVSNRIIFVDGDMEIYEGVKLISKVDYLENVMSDSRLYVEKNNELRLDEFDHEIYLLMDDSKTLITGCSHKGIQNIVDTIENNESITFKNVIGGFHMKKYDEKIQEQKEFVIEMAKDFSKRNTAFITCHCTGDNAFNEMAKHMENLSPLHTGSVVEL